MIELKKGVYWVGAVDWNVRNFHGYITQRGTTYNAYLVVDEKVALVDFVKEPFFEEMLRHIEETADPEEIDYLISNHAEPDHSGAILKTMEVAKDVELIASDMGMKNLREYYGEDLEVTPIKEKPEVSLGGKTLKFVAVPMAHWPDSMVTYIPEEKLLLPNDAFGQHLASSKRFNDEVDQAVLMQEASKYYANILMPLYRSVNKAMEALGGLDIDMIAPSHGVIWRRDPAKILGAYKRWIAGETTEKAVVVYDTMWGSTERIAKALAEGIASGGVPVNVYRLDVTHNSDVIADVLEARAVLVGSPTINNTLFPTVASFLAYMRGLKPMNKVGAAFGSYGWGGGAKRAVEAEMKASGIEVMESGLEFKFRPDEEELEKAWEYGRTVAERVRGG